jgi:hypothetical protein
MKLTDIEFCRVAPFFAALAMVNEIHGVPTETDAKQPAGRSWDNVLKGVAEYTVEKSNKYAVELGVNFPDETERETITLAMREAYEGSCQRVKDALDDCEPTAEELAEMEANKTDQNCAGRNKRIQNTRSEQDDVLALASEHEDRRAVLAIPAIREWLNEE